MNRPPSDQPKGSSSSQSIWWVTRFGHSHVSHVCTGTDLQSFCKSAGYAQAFHPDDPEAVTEVCFELIGLGHVQRTIA